MCQADTLFFISLMSMVRLLLASWKLKEKPQLHFIINCKQVELHRSSSVMLKSTWDTDVLLSYLKNRSNEMHHLQISQNISSYTASYHLLLTAQWYFFWKDNCFKTSCLINIKKHFQYKLVILNRTIVSDIGVSKGQR